MMTYPPGLPCWAPGAVECLASDPPDEGVAVEWGGGASSVWLAPQVTWLHVIEHDPMWIDKIKFGLADEDNFTVHEYSYLDPAYVDCVDEFDYAGLPTLWLIDGYRRIDCLAKVMEKRTEGDIVVMDDALDYAEHLLKHWRGKIERFAMPHPYAGTPIDQARHKKQRNTVRTHHAMTKETWIWRA
jgi:hypothetical protein